MTGYEYPVIRKQVEMHDYLPHIRGRQQEKQEKIATPGSSMGGGTHAFLAQSVSSSSGPLGEEGRELCSFSPPSLRSTHFPQSLSFRIRSK